MMSDGFVRQSKRALIVIVMYSYLRHGNVMCASRCRRDTRCISYHVSADGVCHLGEDLQFDEEMARGEVGVHEPQCGEYNAGKLYCM